jgi:hypothetical protein
VRRLYVAPPAPRLAADENTLYAFAGGELELRDIRSPLVAVPVLASYRTLAAPEKGIAIAGDRAYVGTADSLRVVDISDPEWPQDVGGLELGDTVDIVLAQVGEVYATAGWFIYPGTVNRIDVTEP